jgi:hypothetical protein
LVRPLAVRFQFHPRRQLVNFVFSHFQIHFCLAADLFSAPVRATCPRFRLVFFHYFPLFTVFISAPFFLPGAQPSLSGLFCFPFAPRAVPALLP